MDIFLMILGIVFALIILAIFVSLIYKKFKKPVENTLMDLAGELKLNYYPPVEDKSPFATATYSGRGVTIDLLNEKGYVDRWHPHSRIVVSVDKNIKDTYIVAYRGRFYSRKLGEVSVNYPHFNDKYVLLSSSPKKAEKIINQDVACWIMKLDMPFILSEGSIVFHQDKHFEDKARIKHIIDAFVYIANSVEKLK